MLLVSARLGLLLVTLVASLHVAAEPRVWTLTEVRIGGEFILAYRRDPVAGFVIYDDATRTISNWSVHIPLMAPDLHSPGFTYVPGNSQAYVTFVGPLSGPPIFGFSAVVGVPGPNFGVRQLRLVPLAALDGGNPVVTLDTSESREDSLVVADFGLVGLTTRRPIASGSLTLAAQPPPVVIAQVDEFYHPGLRHYFITADDAEKQALVNGAPPGWERTGESFKAYTAGSQAGGSISPVCRFYSPPQICYEGQGCDVGTDSHFFSADAGECLAVFRGYGRIWGFESDNAFQIDVPDKTTGACPVGTLPVQRLWNRRADSNHRYTTSAAIEAQMLAAGYLAEGVVMCAVP